MTVPSQENPQTLSENKPSDKEINFARMRDKYEKELAQERAARENAERMAREALQRQANVQSNDDEDDDEPYVDQKKLSKTLSSFEKRLDEKIERKAEEKAMQMVNNQRKEMWLKQNPDFYEVMQHVEKFAQADPELAETILEMPDGFERQKLVYKNIKALGIHKPEEKKPTMQEKIDANRKPMYYQPSGIGSSPYSTGGDFSPAGQKNAYDKLQELKRNLRI